VQPKYLKYLVIVMGGSACILAVIGATLQLSQPSGHLNFFSAVAIALSGDIAWLASRYQDSHRWIWGVLLFLANTPLVIAIVQALPA
jgi:hypothetical protein